MSKSDNSIKIKPVVIPTTPGPLPSSDKTRKPAEKKTDATARTSFSASSTSSKPKSLVGRAWKWVKGIGSKVKNFFQNLFKSKEKPLNESPVVDAQSYKPSSKPARKTTASSEDDDSSDSSSSVDIKSKAKPPASDSSVSSSSSESDLTVIEGETPEGPSYNEEFKALNTAAQKTISEVKALTKTTLDMKTWEKTVAFFDKPYDLLAYEEACRIALAEMKPGVDDKVIKKYETLLKSIQTTRATLSREMNKKVGNTFINATKFKSMLASRASDSQAIHAQFSRLQKDRRDLKKLIKEIETKLGVEELDEAKQNKLLEELSAHQDKLKEKVKSISKQNEVLQEFDAETHRIITLNTLFKPEVIDIEKTFRFLVMGFKDSAFTISGGSRSQGLYNPSNSCYLNGGLQMLRGKGFLDEIIRNLQPLAPLTLEQRSRMSSRDLQKHEGVLLMRESVKEILDLLNAEKSATKEDKIPINKKLDLELLRMRHAYFVSLYGANPPVGQVTRQQDSAEFIQDLLGALGFNFTTEIIKTSDEGVFSDLLVETQLRINFDIYAPSDKEQELQDLIEAYYSETFNEGSDTHATDVKKIKNDPEFIPLNLLRFFRARKSKEDRIEEYLAKFKISAKSEYTKKKVKGKTLEVYTTEQVDKERTRLNTISRKDLYTILDKEAPLEDKKIKANVIIPDKLDFSMAFDDGKKHDYEVVAFEIHEGSTVHSGHYFSYRKEGKVWKKYNDTVVSDVSESYAKKEMARAYNFLLKKVHNDDDSMKSASEKATPEDV